MEWNETLIQIPTWALSLLQREGFMLRFQYHTQKSTTYREAYLRTEQEHEQYFLRRHYSDYTSFRNQKVKWQKQREQRKQLSLF